MPSNYKQIAQEHRQGYGSFDHHLEGYEDFYPDDTHFLYELIQNAQDAIARAAGKNRKKRFLRITLRDSDLVAINDGLPFEERHVRAICSVRQSTKDIGQIGAHGIGFKAVGKFTASPEIYSGDERFRIHRRVEPQLVDEVRPEFDALLDAGCTVFRLPFKADIRPADLDRLGERLPHIHKWALLFLHDLRRVEWQDERRGRTGRHTCYRRPHPTIPHATIVRVRSEVDGEMQVEETFLCFSRHRQPPQAVVAELCRQAKTEKERTSILGSRDIPQPIEVAFAFDEGEGVVPLDGGLLFSFLPTRKETHLRFLLQAHYKTTFDRNDIHDLENSPWNRWLVDETAAFIPDIFHSLKEAGLWTPRAFAVLPAPRDDVPDGEGRETVFQPVLAATLKALTEGKLIPTARRGHFAGPTRVFHPHSAALRRLVSGAHLAEITGVQGAKWLDPDLTWGGGTEEILRRCGVKVVSASQVVGWLETKDAEWFGARDDAWLREAYTYLGSQPLRSERARVKGMPLARQEHGKHVCANTTWVFFQPEDDEQRQALAPILRYLPAFRMSLIGGETHDQIKAFLTDIGVEPLEPARVIGQWFLPKYRNGGAFTPEENQVHVRFLLDILDKLPDSELKALREAIQGIPFLWCWKGAERATRGFAAPNQAYLPAAFTGSGNLETYFGQCPEFWMVDDYYLETSDERTRWLEAMKKFGVATLPRRKRNPLDPLADYDKARIRAGRSHTTDIKTEDWLMEGLAAALARIEEREPDAHPTAVSLWRLLARRLPQDEAARQAFWNGTYTWKFRRTEQNAAFATTFYKQLTQTAWVPTHGGGFHKPLNDRLFAPDADTRRVLGDRVRYLHADLGVGEQASLSRALADALGVKLGADIPTVLDHLEEMSGHPADVAEVSHMYQFLLSRAMTGRKELFAEKALIYTPSPQPRWWKSGDVFWADESAAFAETRGYLKPCYPSLKTFFTSVDVPESATFPDFARAVLEAAAERTVTTDVRRRAHYLYQRLWATASVLEDKTEGITAAQTDLWQRLRDAECWLGQSEDAWAWHRRAELLLNDHDFRAKLSSPHLPLWPYTDLDALARFLELAPASLSRPAFTPQGEGETRGDWADKVRGLQQHLVCFFTSPRLAPESPDPAALDILDNLRVVVVAGAEVTYTSHGVTVTDPQPPSSDLEAQDEQATLWITREAEEGEYPLVVGEALEEHFGVRQVGAFASELLGTSDTDRVLARWQKKGLRYEPPAAIPEEAGYGQEEKGRSQGDGADADADTSVSDESGTDHQGVGGSVSGQDSGNGGQDGDENDDAEGSAGGSRDSGQGSHGGRRYGGGGGGGRGSGGGGGGPETDIHKGLKKKIRADPAVIASGLSFFDEEYDVASGQAGSRVDILLKDADGRPVSVEVKPLVETGDYSVVWQAVRYKHLLAVDNGLDCEAVRSFLVAPELPHDIKLKCDLMGIEYREIAP